MRKIANILGTGGQARVIVSLLLSLRNYDKVVVFELGKLRKGESIMGFKVLSFEEKMKNLDCKREEDFFLAIGCNKQRKRYWDLLNEKKVSIPNLVSPNSYIDPSANLGKGNVICHQAFIGPCSEVGDNNLINTSALMEHESKIGSHCHLAPKSVLAGRSTLGNSCFLGAGAQIIDQLQVASGTTIGAGACLIESIFSENQVYVGVPAKLIKIKE